MASYIVREKTKRSKLGVNAGMTTVKYEKEIRDGGEFKILNECFR